MAFHLGYSPLFSGSHAAVDQKKLIMQSGWLMQKPTWQHTENEFWKEILTESSQFPSLSTSVQREKVNRLQRFRGVIHLWQIISGRPGTDHYFSYHSNKGASDVDTAPHFKVFVLIKLVMKRDDRRAHLHITTLLLSTQLNVLLRVAIVVTCQ